MRARLVALSLCVIVAVVPSVAGSQGNNCSFPGQGIGVGGTPGKNGSPGTFPGGGATGGAFPGGNCGGGGTVSTNEPLMLGLTGLALLGASMLGRRQR